ncbi:MAG: PorP/SprF family type IX secretion system membrane protein [Luteibaculaceae bacterium]
MKKYLHKVIGLLLLVLVGGFAKGQQLPQFTQFMFNPYLINPAFAGKDGYFNAVTTHRSQWVGITDAPQTYALSLEGPLNNKKVGVGGYIFSDNVGPTRRTGFQGSYAYHVNLNEKYKLSMSLSAGLLQFEIDGSKITFKDQNDIAFINQLRNDLVFDAKFGFLVYSDNLFFGASAPQLLQNKLFFFDNQEQSLNRLEDHYFAMVGGKVNLGDNFHVEPSLLVRYVFPAQPQFDLNTRVVYKETFWLGSSYRHLDAVAIMGGATIGGVLNMAYSYDITTSNLRNYSSGTHEVMLGLRLVKNRVLTPKEVE